MFHSITTLAWDHLITDECIRENNLTRLWEEKADNSCYEYWLTIFEKSKTPLALALKEKVQNSGISYETFFRSMVDIYFTLDGYLFSSKTGIHVEPEDVKYMIEFLKFDQTQYECLKILFSLHETYGMKI